MDNEKIYVAKQTEVNNHINDKNDPHEVTAEQTGARPNTWMPTAADVGARPSDWMPSASDVGARPDTWMPSAADVGLGNVNNTSDANKPVSNAQATAIADAKKAGTDAQVNLTAHVTNKNNPHGVTAGQLGLGNVASDISNIKDVLNGKTAKTLVELTLTTNWIEQSDGSFTKTMTVADVVSGCDIIADCKLSGTDLEADVAILEAWSCVNRVDDSKVGSLTFHCYGTAPTVSIPVNLLIFV